MVQACRDLHCSGAPPIEGYGNNLSPMKMPCLPSGRWRKPSEMWGDLVRTKRGSAQSGSASENLCRGFQSVVRDVHHSISNAETSLCAEKFLEAIPLSKKFCLPARIGRKSWLKQGYVAQDVSGKSMLSSDMGVSLLWVGTKCLQERKTQPTQCRGCCA